MSADEHHPTVGPNGIYTIPAQPSDTDELVEIAVSAYKSDLFSILMATLAGDPDAHQKAMKRSLETWFASPTTRVIQAVDCETGKTLGWAVWEVRGREKKEDDHVKRVDEKIEVQATGGEARSEKSNPSKSLGRQMYEQKLAWEEANLKPLGRYNVLSALCVLPSAQGLGIGSKLISVYGTDVADACNEVCYAHASPAAVSVYLRAGFEEKGSQNIDLCEWAPGEDDGGNEWGMYIFRHMVRQPRNALTGVWVDGVWHKK